MDRKINYKYIFTRSLLLAILLFIPVLESVSNDESEEIYKKDIDAIGLVTDHSGSVASGFFINENTFITNHHVSSELDIKSAKIEMKDDRVFRVKKIIREYSKQDLAIIETEETSSDYLELNTDKKINEKDIVYSVGNPTDDWNDVSYFKMTKGAIKTIDDDEWYYDNPDDASKRHSALVIQHTAIIKPGNSGGPLLNSDGKVVGVNTFFYDDSLNYAIHVDELIKCLKKNDIKFNQFADVKNKESNKKEKKVLTFRQNVERFFENRNNVALIAVVLFFSYGFFVIFIISSISFIVILKNRKRRTYYRNY